MAAVEHDAIQPPVARRPEDVCTLLADAISDGDLDAALGHYESGAEIAIGLDVVLTGLAEIRRMLAIAVDARQHYAIRPRQVLRVHGLAFVTAEARTFGTGPDSLSATSAGEFSAVVRLGPDGVWRIALARSPGLHWTAEERAVRAFPDCPN